MLAHILLAVLAADAVAPPAIFKVPEGATFDLHDGDGPFLLPPRSYLFTEAAFIVVNSELQRLQALDNAEPKSTVVSGIPAQGYLIMAGIVAAVFLAGGIGIGVFVSGQGIRF